MQDFRKFLYVLPFAWISLTPMPVLASDNDDAKFAEYRDSLEEGNPGEFWVTMVKNFSSRKPGRKTPAWKNATLA